MSLVINVSHLRLHKSSIIIGIFLAAFLVLIEVPGRIVDGYPSGWMTLEHGWPFNYLRRDAKGNAPGPLFITIYSDAVAERPMLGVPWLALDNWQLWEAPTEPEVLGLETPHWDFNGGILICDIAIAMLLLAGVVAAWEIRRRQRPTLFSFGLTDMFVAVAFMSALLGWGVFLQREYEREDRLVETALNDFTGPWQGDDEVCIAPVWIRSLVGERLLPGFMWRTASVRVYADETENVADLANELSELSYLREIAIDGLKVDKQFTFSAFNRIKRLESLYLEDRVTNVEYSLDELAKLRQLKKIVLWDEEWVESKGIQRLAAELPNCRIVDSFDDW